MNIMQQPSNQICPECGALADSNAKTCPQCGHAYPSQFAAPENQTQSPTPSINDSYPMQPQFWQCPNCHGNVPLNQRYCTNCGFQLKSTETIKPPHMTLIIVMWALHVLSMLTFYTGTPGLSVIIDFPSLIIAIVLVNQKNKTDRINGWIIIGLEIVGFLIGFIRGFIIGFMRSAARSGY
jgi:RNA polymerase subunit RPABC4/transcription elongation factor Spt4